jgi:hypothetical protein
MGGGGGDVKRDSFQFSCDICAGGMSGETAPRSLVTCKEVGKKGGEAVCFGNITVRIPNHSFSFPEECLESTLIHMGLGTGTPILHIIEIDNDFFK